MNMYKPPHKHVGDEGKPGQIINRPALNQDKSLGKAIEEYKEDIKKDKKLSDYDWLQLQRFFNSMNGR